MKVVKQFAPIYIYRCEILLCRLTKRTLIPYILKEKHCNKCIHTIIDTWQSHNNLIINMLTRSHYIHKCVHTIFINMFTLYTLYFFLNIKLICMVPIKLWIFRFESKQITNQKLNYIYIIFIVYR